MGAPSFPENHDVLSSFLRNWQAHCQQFPSEIPSYSEIYHPEMACVATAYNQVQSQSNPLAHSEWTAILDACDRLGTKILKDCRLLTALEPCLHCMGAILKSRISEVVYFLPAKPNEGISHLPPEMIYQLNHFPRLRLEYREEIFSRFQSFFIDKR